MARGRKASVPAGAMGRTRGLVCAKAGAGEGGVGDPAVVAAGGKQLWVQAKFSSKKVVVGVANQKVVVRQVDLPWLPTNELKKALAFQVQDFIPMPVEQAILDYHPLAAFPNGSGARMLRALLAPAQDRHQHADTEVKALEDEVAGPQDCDQDEPDGGEPHKVLGSQ